MDQKECREYGRKLLENIEKVIVGKEETIQLLLAALLSGGHVLLEDMPGTGKTKLAKSLAASMEGVFSRIQFTPDLLPSDVTGMNIYNRKSGEFVLHKGPVFANVLLADEINRAMPRTQAGLLECMEEHQVTIDGQRLMLESPFMVIATQNPVESAGTFPLPEAQMDRFMMRLSMGLPDQEEEVLILERFGGEDPYEKLESVITREQILQMREAAKEVYVHPVLQTYIVELAAATRKEPELAFGVSPRGSLALMQAAKAYAAFLGRSYCTPDDVRALAVPVFSHRLGFQGGRRDTARQQALVQRILKEVPVPAEEFSK
ncbi:putative uncharacterized protein [Firmicutes bacterium CAG:534]|nr:putative uncharacterized protein [Firmicutes bacterium CAG:534]